MAVSAKMLRSQLKMIKPRLRSCSLETIRTGQSKIGELMEAKNRDLIFVKSHSLLSFSESLTDIIP